MEGVAKKLCFILIIIISGILQVTILDYFKIFTVKPDLLLISMVLASLAFEFRWAFALSIFAGFFKDAFSVTSFGINTLLFGLWSFLTLRLSKEITIDNDIIRVILVFIVTLIHNTFVGLVFIYSGNHIPSGIFLRIVSLSAIYTAV
ncbi:MAG: rod shape-determining protein MreD, partial [Candidatus Omnitrophica bacterium]|nr:rod shape-determining protein MreD [Candidatus Omnitrophota bacterium]